MKQSITSRIANSIKVQDNGCWVWTRRRDRQGYGVMWIYQEGKKYQRFAHRMSYEAHKGLIPANKQIDHLCMNKSCVNPAHLEVVTSKENTQRYFQSIDIDRYCRNGHRRTSSNTYISGKTKYCKICHRYSSAAYRKRKEYERAGLAPR